MGGYGKGEGKGKVGKIVSESVKGDLPETTKADRCPCLLLCKSFESRGGSRKIFGGKLTF